jgi:hypothetical protein
MLLCVKEILVATVQMLLVQVEEVGSYTVAVDTRQRYW